MLRAFLLIFLFGSLVVALPAYAQGVGVTPVDISLSPEYPKPYQTVAVTIRSTVVELSSSSVVVSVNGAVVERGTGVVTAYVRVGGPGERTTISVSVTANGQTYTKQAVIRPADVSLVVEPTSTTHPFYQGSGLVASEGRVRLVAVPDIRTSAGALVPAGSLVYVWRMGDQVLESSSGIGRSVLSATAPVRYRDADVSVTVSTQDSSVVAQAQTTVAPVDPFIRIYRNDPLLGPLFDLAYAGSITMGDDEETFRMVPYHFATRPLVSWAVNSVAGGGDDDITVRATGSGAGSALLTAQAQRTENLQSANTSLGVRFGELKPLGIFGL